MSGQVTRIGQVSPDGRFAWDGGGWRPISGHRLEPTAATAPMRVLTGAFLLLAGILGVVLPTLTRSYVQQATIESIHRQSPGLTPLELHRVVAFSVSVGIGIAVALGLVYVLLGVLTLAWRASWLFYADLVVLALMSVGVVTTIVGFVRGNAGPPGFAVPNLVLSLAALALFAWLLRALIRVGPWACLKVPLSEA
jgi:magnesium-transporting ATPase (P-type)